MTKTISRKGDIRPLLSSVLTSYREEGVDACIHSFHELILLHKVKFPLLEFCALELFSDIPPKEHIYFCDRIEASKQIGGNVILGIFLQQRLSTDFDSAIRDTTRYISKGKEWYVSDIIGERVFGHALLNHFNQIQSLFPELYEHRNNMVVRAMGAGTHYAIKKGLSTDHCTLCFEQLLKQSEARDHEIRRGIGWAAKTTAKFHPSIVLNHPLFEAGNSLPGWLVNKINIGLNRHAYAQRDSS
ncbi:MAG: DNA alkylation repair protein [Bacteroidetes bacterium]|nr:MAG: DNA alkylation repair protein [Bacteroidota bacterium]